MNLSYYTYKSELVSCKKCNWSGLGSDTFLSEFSEIHTLRDIECPECGTTIYTFDLVKIDEEQKKLGNPGPLEKVCFNCPNMIWMVGVGMGVKCKLDMKDIPNRRHTCESFEYK